MRRIAWVVWIAVIGACVGPQLRRPPPPEPARQASLDVSITSYMLGNGLRVVLVKDPKAQEIQVTMRYQVGSVDDPQGRLGMAHLVEHLMYEPVLGGESLFARLEAVTTYFNGATTYDATTYISRAAPAQLDELLAIEAARIDQRCTSITASAFARERAVVINEIRQRDQASETLVAIHQALYPIGHPYRRPVGGSIESVSAITRDQACAFADAHYAPNNAALVVAGNFTAEQQAMVLYKFVAVSAKRTVVAPVPIYQVPFQPMFVAAPVPFDDDALLVAWPLPTDPRLRAKVRALVAATETLVENEVDGSVTTIELGDTRAPLIGLVVLPATGESLQHAKEGTERAVARLPGILDQNDPAGAGGLLFTKIQQSAVYRLYATLEEDERDSRLASLVLSGGDPRTVFGEELGGLDTFSSFEATYLARDQFTLQRAKVVVLQATTGPKRNSRVGLDAPIHDLGQPRRIPELAEAHRPALPPIAGPGISGMTLRTLRNGMQVVLLPSTSVPTVEMRVVFHAGTSDEAADKRGVALLAAHALEWDLRYEQELFAFAMAGGSKSVVVGTDSTSFTTHGLDMHLDRLLGGLRTWVLAGKYDTGVNTALAALQRERTRRDDDAALVDAWRATLYGAAHPYTRAGIVRHASATLTAADAAQFRAARYTPDNATLVIVGRFDPAIADKWIDYLFEDWQGRAQPRPAARVALRPLAIARIEDLAQVRLQIALPATIGNRAEQLVANEMLAAIVGDVRHQLGASYDLSATLVEQRLATTYVITGWIDAARTTAAIQLVRDRITKLRTDPDATARAFVIARNRIATHSRSVSGSAETLAAHVERDVTLRRAPLTDQNTAVEVQNLTIDRMTAVLGELDLARAAIALRGPATEITRAFDALGRKPFLIR